MKKMIAAAMLSAAFILTPALPVAAAPVELSDGSIFDPEYYAEQNPDVVATFGTDAVNLYRHYIIFGKSEGRLPYAGADHETAKAENAEATLQAAETDADNTDGEKADNTETAVPDGSIFDPVFYATNNPDVVAALGTDEAVLYHHYMDYGRYEGRLACAPGTEAESAYELPSYRYARAVLDQVGWDAKAAFKWCTHLRYYGHGKPDMPENGTPGTEWFADFGFINRKGNCYVMSATFCRMASLLGYDAQQVSGYVPSRNGGLAAHSWVEITIDGQIYVCDVSFDQGTGKNGYMIRYGQSGTWRYTDYVPMCD